MELNAKSIERFFKKVEKTSSCWNWKGILFKQGYGRIASLNKVKSLKAHRISWEIHFGKIPDGLCVLHKCDNRKCVRPDHLWLGTKFENNQDRSFKKRSAYGLSHPNGKISTSEVLNIKKIYNTKNISQYKLAEMFGVSQSLISFIINNKQRIVA